MDGLSALWYRYRDAWPGRPWLPVLLGVGLVLAVVGLVSTALTTPLALVFVPGLALVYLHHVLVQRLER